MDSMFVFTPWTSWGIIQQQQFHFLSLPQNFRVKSSDTLHLPQNLQLDIQPWSYRRILIVGCARCSKKWKTQKSLGIDVRSPIVLRLLTLCRVAVIYLSFVLAKSENSWLLLPHRRCGSLAFSVYFASLWIYTVHPSGPVWLSPVSAVTVPYSVPSPSTM